MDQKELKKAGLKVTSSRLKILNILEQSANHHLSAEEIFSILSESGEDVSVATIYRVLSQFESAGLVTKHNFEGGYAVFELNQGVHHDHLVCVKCGYVEEFVDEVIEERQEKIAQQAGFKMTDHHLNIYGICKRCKD